MHKFGYYEIRCKLPKNDGWHAAFWLQAPGIGSHPDPKYAGAVAENWAGTPVDVLKKAVLPDEFIVDCVRVFDEVE